MRKDFREWKDRRGRDLEWNGHNVESLDQENVKDKDEKKEGSKEKGNKERRVKLGCKRKQKQKKEGFPNYE